MGVELSQECSGENGLIDAAQDWVAQDTHLTALQEERLRPQEKVLAREYSGERGRQYPD